MTKRHLMLGACLMALSGCTLPAPLTPSVRQTADEFSQTMDDYADKALLANVLRARDFAPLNFAELTNISGQLNYSATAGVNAPFGEILGTGRNNASAGVSASATPSLTLGTLDTQNFTTTLLQPVSASYIAAKWNDGHSHALLLYLFVKSIRFANDTAPHLNDPDHMADFRALVDQMLAQNAELHSLVLLDPVGSPVSFSNGNTGAAGGMQISMGNTPAISALSLISGLNDGQLHAANAPCPGGGSGCAQIYKEYPATVALCVPAIHDPADDTYKFDGRVVYATPEHGGFAGGRARAGLALLDAAIAATTPIPPSSSSSGGGGGGSSGPGGGGGGNMGGGQSGSTLGAMTQVNAALSAGRIGTILDSADCGSDQIVLSPAADQALESGSPRGAHIEWRSISEVIQYLGAIARNQNDPTRVAMWGGDQELFRVNQGSGGRINVSYQGTHYSLPGELADVAGNDPHNHSLEALGLINELIGTAKESSDLPQL